jgi:peptide/nickel transport system substrate-binding protein
MPGPRLSRRELIAAGAGFAAVSLGGAAHAAPTRGGTLVFARYADSQILNPIKTELNVDIWVMNSIYDTLLMPTLDGKGLMPGLATRWDWGDEGKSLTLTLREGVKFSNGLAMQASDVKWSLDRARDPKNGPWSDVVASIETVEIANPTTIVLKLKHPDPALLPALAMFNTGIMPQSLFEAAPGNTPDEKATAFAERPIGSGPFMVADWKRNEILRLARNPHYWRMAADGKPFPYVDQVDMPVIPDDATRILKLRAGEAHAAEFIPYARVKELQADAKLRMELWPSTKTTYVILNTVATWNGKPNPLSDVRVRQALNHAVNKDAVIAITTHGLGKPASSFISSATPLHTGTGPVFPYDPAKAKALLTEAGFANGFDLVCHALAGNEDDKNNLTTIQQMLAKVGVRMTLEQLDNATRVARWRKGDFQMRSSYWTDDIFDPSEITGFMAFSPTTKCLYSGFKSERIDALFQQSQSEVDPKKRAAQYAEIQQIWNTTGPLMLLYETPYPVAWRKEITGFVQLPLGNNYFDGVTLG